jgi:hypothetical protein
MESAQGNPKTLNLIAEQVRREFADKPEEYAPILAGLGRVYVGMRCYEDAIREFRNSLRVTNDLVLRTGVRSELAKCLLRTGQNKEGTEILEQLFQERLQLAAGRDATEMRMAWLGRPRADIDLASMPRSNGLDFDGDRDYVVLPTVQFDGRPPWTIEAIVRPLEIGQYAGEHGGGWTSLVSATQSGAIGLETRDGKWAIELFSASETAHSVRDDYAAASASIPVRLDVWQHVAGVWDGSELRLYVDGKLHSSTPHVDYCTQLSDGPFFLGADPNAREFADIAQGYLHGRMRAARISRGVEYTADFPAPERLEKTQDTVAFYDFTIDTGRYALDRSGHGHHGIIVGARFVPAAKVAGK